MCVCGAEVPWQNPPETLVLSLGVRGPQERGSQVVPAGQIFPGSKTLAAEEEFGFCFRHLGKKHILLNFLCYHPLTLLVVHQMQDDPSENVFSLLSSYLSAQLIYRQGSEVPQSN